MPEEETATEPAPARPKEPAVTVRRGRTVTAAVVLPLAVAAIALVALSAGRYPIPLTHVAGIVFGRVLPVPHVWTGAEERVVLLVRLPRVLLSLLIGAGLAVCGAVLQAAFRNPLVNPQILGVSSGAAFGGVLALVAGLGSAALFGSAFAFGLVALLMIFMVSRVRAGSPMLMVVLAGVVTGSFFSALVSLVKYLADPYDDLPSIVFWLLGSLATADYGKVALAAGPILLGCVIVLALRWRINILTLGDEDARALGVHPHRLRWVLLCAVAAMVAAAVAVSGEIGWVGLVVPHLARLWVGPDHRILLGTSLLLGAGYLTVIDTAARLMTASEIPLGVLTALIGAPVFFVLLRRGYRRMWLDA